VSAPTAGKAEGARVVVVTGAGRGIGAAIARRMFDDGWHVVAVDRDSDGLDALAEQLPGIETHTVDVTDRDAVGALFSGIEERRGRVDGVVNNAMWVRYVPLAEVTEELIDGMLAIGLKAAFWTTQAAAPLMAARGEGAIVNLSSPAATRGFPGSSVYSAVKGAVSSLTWQLARELGPQGIRVNAVVPGAVPTPGARQVVDDEGYEVRRQMAALKRLAEPDDIAAAVAYLLSSDASFVTGHLLAADGGL